MALQDARGRVDGSGAKLQAGRSQVRDTMRLLNVPNLTNPSSPTIALSLLIFYQK
jgi:hypothetical protein